MAALCRKINRLTYLAEQFSIPVLWPGFIRLKFTKTRIIEKMFEVEPSDHAKYKGDLDQPYQLHIISRIKYPTRRPYWEKKIVNDLGLAKSNQPRIHKNVPSVNNKRKAIKHLIRMQTLKLPQGPPAEQELADTYLKSTGD
ncbi:39S ribosomal protein L30, mitochondrial-like [Scyliorhinus canicula]|uniref:39S ribosomal protein L30, mitochondrial-like n=1 Tax=Scyliorhinus canicula TaxID=7830 RepID=UPI0018F4979B|nr:39S ribosomal protein L30, mitochondrial-like [Scyliorhinus canicula]